MAVVLAAFVTVVRPVDLSRSIHVINLPWLLILPAYHSSPSCWKSSSFLLNSLIQAQLVEDVQDENTDRGQGDFHSGRVRRFRRVVRFVPNAALVDDLWRLFTGQERILEEPRRTREASLRPCSEDDLAVPPAQESLGQVLTLQLDTVHYRRNQRRVNKAMDLLRRSVNEEMSNNLSNSRDPFTAWTYLCDRVRISIEGAKIRRLLNITGVDDYVTAQQYVEAIERFYVPLVHPRRFDWMKICALEGPSPGFKEFIKINHAFLDRSEIERAEWPDFRKRYLSCWKTYDVTKTVKKMRTLGLEVAGYPELDGSR